MTFSMLALAIQFVNFIVKIIIISFIFPFVRLYNSIGQKSVWPEIYESANNYKDVADFKSR